MLDALFVLFIVALVGYVIAAPRKELPLLVVLHAALQYTLLMLIWRGVLPKQVALLGLAFMFISSVSLIWARTLQFSRSNMFFRTSLSIVQWFLVSAMFASVFLGQNNTFVLIANSNPGIAPFSPYPVNETTKLMGNLIIFTTFMQVVLYWGQKWSLRKSLLDLGPSIIYFCTVLGLHLMRTVHTINA